MAGLQASLRIIVGTGSPGVLPVTRQLNRLIADISPGNFYVTMFLAEIDAAEGRMTYVNAGLEPPLLLRAESGRVERLEDGGTVLGLTSRSRYQCGTVSLHGGDTLIGFTDGITESTNPKGLEMTEEGILSAVRNCVDRSAGVLVDAILRHQQRFTGGTPASDDRTVVVVQSTRRGAL